MFFFCFFFFKKNKPVNAYNQTYSSNNILNNKKNDKKYSTSIVLNLDKYKVQDTSNMVTIPAPPKKYNTFVDTMNVAFGEVPKPVTRTGSTINSVSVFF